MPRSFDEAIEYLIREIEDKNIDIINLINDQMIPGYYLSFTEFTPEQLQILKMAADQVYIKLTDRLRTFSKQGISESEIKGYAGFAFAFNQLRILLHLDPRIREEHLDELKQIVVNETARWEAPLWLYNFILDSLAYYHSLLKGQNHLLSLLTNEQNRVGNCDLRPLAGPEFCILLNVLQERAEYFKSETGGVIAYGTTFTPQVSQKIKELFALCLKDQRSPAEYG
jgi:hypothetical protein